MICQSAAGLAAAAIQARHGRERRLRHPAFAVKQIMKDLDIIGEVSRQYHCPMPLVAPVRQQYEAAFANGCGDLDFSVLTREARAYRGPVKPQDLMTQRQRRRHRAFRRTCRRNKEGARIWEARRSQLLAQGRMAPP